MASKETIHYSVYEVVPQKRSAYVHGLMVDDDEHAYLQCPACARHNRTVEHGATRQCECGLFLQRYGNTLTIWREHAP